MLYVGDVPVEASYHGSALLHRLLRGWPADRLRIIESNLGVSRVDRRLPGVRYDILGVGRGRWLNTRFHPWVSAFYSFRAAGRASGLREMSSDFQAEALVTVAHGYSWLAAARYAREAGVPLHLIVHDDWPRVAGMPKATSWWLESAFSRVYASASSRLCVSPYMALEYERRYGVRGQVLYPSRAPDATVFPEPRERMADASGALVVGFGGTVNTSGHVVALRKLAGILSGIGGRLEIFGPMDAQAAERAGLAQPNVGLRGLVKASDFVSTLREHVDVLFAPMSFSPEDASNMALCFPSKLTEYTAAGLPILVFGPEYSSAVQWARANPGAALVVTEEEGSALDRAVRQLLADASLRRSLAARAIEVGEAQFSARSAERVFAEAVLGERA